MRSQNEQVGGLRVARSKTARYCGATRSNGSQCRAWALRDSEPPRCKFHSMTPEELRAHQQRGRRARTENARRRHGVVPPALVAKAGDTIAALLDAEIEPGEPDYQYRAWGVLALAVVFKIPPDDRRRLLEVVHEARPRLGRDPQVERILDVERARSELVELYRAGEIARYMLPPEVEAMIAPQPAPKFSRVVEA
jgi:hypothetical protein